MIHQIASDLQIIMLAVLQLIGLGWFVVASVKLWRSILKKKK